MTVTGQLKYDHPLTNYNSWRVGGNASCFYQPASLLDLSHNLKRWNYSGPILWLGLGSNLLIRDQGYDGLVIAPTQRLNALNRVGPHTVRAEAGVISAKLARFCADNGLGESEFFAGIPGTVGGALAMNAGAFGGETWQYVEAVETMDRYGNIELKHPHDFTIRYREVTTSKEEWFVAGYFTFPASSPAYQKQAIRQLLQKRAQSQPIGKYNCGSVFRNPIDDYAARLIQQAGFKGYRLGGAFVSEKHANFIINDGTATARDIESLIFYIQQYIGNHAQKQLRPEVHIYGEGEPILAQ